MTIEYRIKFEDGGLVITQTTAQRPAPEENPEIAAGNVAASHELGSSLREETGGGGNANTSSGH